MLKWQLVREADEASKIAAHSEAQAAEWKAEREHLSANAAALE
jgi:hypothetical protein